MTFQTFKGTREAREDKETRLAALYDEYYNKIARYAFVRIGNRTEAEDIAGEVFLKALESIKTYEERGLPMQAWLFKIAHNQVVDYLRKASKRPTVPIENVEIPDGTDPESTAITNLEMEGVRKAMESLTEEQREILRLRFFGGLPSKEVAAILNKSDGAVREMQRAALLKLRQLLNNKEDRSYN
jgi:RNA polymerase sigma-70 factor (ECF subfamily)